MNVRRSRQVIVFCRRSFHSKIRRVNPTLTVECYLQDYSTCPHHKAWPDTSLGHPQNLHGATHSLTERRGICERVSSFQRLDMLRTSRTGAENMVHTFIHGDIPEPQLIHSIRTMILMLVEEVGDPLSRPAQDAERNVCQQDGGVPSAREIRSSCLCSHPRCHELRLVAVVSMGS